MRNKKEVNSKLDLLEAWLADKYLIMEYSIDAHNEIKNMLKGDIDDDVIISKYTEITEDIFSKKPETLSKRNTAYYIWGHLKNIVTKEEKKKMFALLDISDKAGGSLREAKIEFYKLAVKYEISTLLRSNYFRDVKGASIT